MPLFPSSYKVKKRYILVNGDLEKIKEKYIFLFGYLDFVSNINFLKIGEKNVLVVNKKHLYKVIFVLYLLDYEFKIFDTIKNLNNFIKNLNK